MIRRPGHPVLSSAVGTPPSVHADIIVLMPVYNDWESCPLLIRRLDEALRDRPESFAIVLVDDGSSTPAHGRDDLGDLEAIGSVYRLRLRRNLGHQRAICVGLAYIDAHAECRGVVIMDADGEDDPADVPRLLEAWDEAGGRAAVFAERTRRSESLLFQASYAAYRLAHRVLTGRGVRVGNFSVISRALVGRLVVTSELWSHYAAAVFVSRLPVRTVPTARAPRLTGRSTMDFAGLVVHGLSAISVFSDVVGVRLLLASLLAVVLSTAGIVGVAGVRLLTDLAVPGWATYTTGIFIIVMLLAIMFSFLLTVTVLADRKSAAMLPARDFAYFIEGLHTWTGLRPAQSARFVR